MLLQHNHIQKCIYFSIFVSVFSVRLEFVIFISGWAWQQCTFYYATVNGNTKLIYWPLWTSGKWSKKIKTFRVLFYFILFNFSFYSLSLSVNIEAQFLHLTADFARLTVLLFHISRQSYVFEYVYNIRFLLVAWTIYAVSF